MLLLPILGCDPGMTIHQAVQRSNRNGLPATPNLNDLTISVRTFSSLIGYSSYAPDVTVTNSSASSITIKDIELTAKGIVYANRQQDGYPFMLAPGQTQVFGGWFDLREDLWKTFFKQRGDLRVNYVKDGQEMTAHAAIAGDRRNAKAA